MYTISGVGVVVFSASQPKKVGRLFRPRFTKVLASGTAGKEVPFAMGSRLRAYVAIIAVPFGQFGSPFASSVSADESMAKMTSRPRSGWVRG